MFYLVYERIMCEYTPAFTPKLVYRLLAGSDSSEFTVKLVA